MARRSVCEAGQERLCAASIAMVMQYWQRSSGSHQMYRTQPRFNDLLLRPSSWHLCVRDGALPEAAWISHICISRTDRRHQGSFGKGSATDRCPEAFDGGRNAALCCSGGIGPRSRLVLKNDPAERKLLKQTQSDFEREWKGTGNWTLLAVPLENGPASSRPSSSQ